MAIDTSWKPVTVPDLGGSAFLTFSAALRKNALNALQNITSQSQKYMEMKQESEEKELARKYDEIKTLFLQDAAEKLAERQFEHNKQLNDIRYKNDLDLLKYKLANAPKTSAGTSSSDMKDIAGLLKVLSNKRTPLTPGARKSVINFLTNHKDVRYQNMVPNVDYLDEATNNAINAAYDAHESKGTISKLFSNLDYGPILANVTPESIEGVRRRELLANNLPTIIYSNVLERLAPVQQPSKATQQETTPPQNSSDPMDDIF